jgi:hypothetical protein
VSVGFDQSGRRRLGCAQRRKARRRDHRLTVTPAGDGHGRGADHDRGRSRPCHRDRDPRAPPPRRAHRRHPRRRDRAAVPAELPGVLGRGPHSHARAREPRRRRDRWVAQVRSTVDARCRSSRTPTPASVPCSSTGEARSTRAGARSDGDVVDAQLGVAVPELDDARPRVGYVRWADRSGGPRSRVTSKVRGVAASIIIPLRLAAPLPCASASPTADTTAVACRSWSGRAPL